MSQEELAEVAVALASEYPGGDKAGTAQDFQRVVEAALPSLTDRASLAIDRGIEDVTEVWQVIRQDSEGLFAEALGKVDRVKIIFVASKFINNKLIGEMITQQALEIARHGRENLR